MTLGSAWFGISGEEGESDGCCRRAKGVTGSFAPAGEIVITNEFFRILVQDSGDVFLLCDTGGKIRFWNRAAEGVFVYAESEAIGQSLDIIIPERLRGRHWKGY